MTALGEMLLLLTFLLLLVLILREFMKNASAKKSRTRDGDDGND